MQAITALAGESWLRERAVMRGRTRQEAGRCRRPCSIAQVAIWTRELS